MEELSHLGPDSLTGQLEALLLVSAEAVPARDLARTLGVDEEGVQAALEALSDEYAAANRGFQLRQVAGGWRLFTHPAFHEQVRRYVLSWDRRRLSQAALETLAIVAWRQPVTRDGVRSVRGVNSDASIASLRSKGLVREVGRDERNAALFGTTDAFLESLGLRSLDELPPLEDFAPDEETRRFIRERLSSGQGAGAEADPDAVEAGEGHE